MILEITSERQVTFPQHVLDSMGVGPGDRLEIHEAPNGFLLRPECPAPAQQPIDLSMLGGLRDKIPPGTPPFDIRKFRDEGYDPYKYRD